MEQPDAAPSVPFFKLIDLVPRELGEGTAMCDMLHDDWLGQLGVWGTPAGLPALADCALAYATSRAGPPDTGAVSVSLHLDYVAPPPPGGVRLSCRGNVLHLDNTYAMAEGRILDDGGSVLATASLRSLAVAHDRMGFSGPPPTAAAAGVAAAPTGAAPSGEVSAPAPRSASTSLGPVEATGDVGRLLGSQAAELLGLQPVVLTEGQAELAAMPPPGFERTAGVVHGGAMGIIGHVAMAFALHSVVPEGANPLRVDFHIDYLRPAPMGFALTLRSRVVHRSRRVAVVTGEVLTADGKVAAMVRETALLGT